MIQPIDDRPVLHLNDEFWAYKTGLAPHYPFLYYTVLNLEATRTLEFGAGLSTRVILDALDVTGGAHVSLSTDSREHVEQRYVLRGSSRWLHLTGHSRVTLPGLLASCPTDAFDLVLHDGSHDADVVADDLRAIWPFVRHRGLILVHDALHSHAGKNVWQGIANAKIPGSSVTLPFGFGLTIISVWNPTQPAVTVTRQKRGSPHYTEVGW